MADADKFREGGGAGREEANWGDYSSWRINDQIIQEWGSFSNASFNNLKAVNLKVFANYEEIYT